MSIRKINVEDEGQINELYKQLYPDFNGKVDLTEKSFETKYLPLCVEENGVIVGFATGTIVKFGTQRYGYIEDLIVNESKKGLGYGSKLVREILNQFKNEGVEVAFVTLDTVNDKSIENFYRGFDFQPCKNSWFCKPLGKISD